jgi:hypothetical protein
MAWKIVLGGFGLLAGPLGKGRTLAWYAQRRFERA